MVYRNTMATIKFNNLFTTTSTLKSIEVLNVHEMLNIRGGDDREKMKTKEMDVYDTRED